MTPTIHHAASIFDAAGGETVFLRRARHQRCLANPVLSHPFSHLRHPQHSKWLAASWVEVFGGPPTYTRMAGSHATMVELHARTRAERDLGTRFVRCFVAAFDDAGLPADPELRGAPGL